MMLKQRTLTGSGKVAPTAFLVHLGPSLATRCHIKVNAARGPSLQQSARSKAPSEPREVVVGIDLGTTNSAIAIIENGKPRCIPNAHGSRLTPSVVTFMENGEVVVGRDAKRMGVTRPTTTYSSVKRLIGRQYADPLVKEDIARLPYKVGQDEEGAVTLLCDAVERGFLYPEEVSAQILAQLLADAEQFTGGVVRKAIISVPAYFDTKQREATMDAGRLAGLETIRILREPVAAALAYGLDLKQDRTVLVFDLGGGTFDVSILEVGNGTVEVLSTGGDPHLGGDDWDAAIVDWLTKEYVRATAAAGQGAKAAGSTPPILKEPKFQANMRALAELAKISLSTSEEVTLKIPAVGAGGQPLAVVLTRAKLDELSTELWRRCRLPLDQACWNAGVDLEEAVGQLEARKKDLRSRGVPAWKTETLKPEIRPKRRGPLGTVLLVGGATRMPAVRQFLRNMTGVEPIGPDEDGKHSRGVDPDEAVALGAAVQAGVLQGEVTGLMVMDQWQASLMRALAEMKLRTDPAAKQAVQQQYNLDDEGEAEDEGQEELLLDESDEDLNEDQAQSPTGRQTTAGRRLGGSSSRGGVSTGEQAAAVEGAEDTPKTGPGGKRLTKRSLRRMKEREARMAAAAAAAEEE